MWEAMFSVPQTLHNVLRELHIQLQDRRYRVLSTPLEDISILRLALLASSDLEEEEFAPMYLAGRFLRQRRPAMLSLVLSGIMTLSEKEEMARKMLVLLPDLRRVLFFGYKAVTMKALVVFRHLLAQLEREKASPIAVQLAEFVLPFFDDVRLLGKPEPRGWEAGNDSCPSTQPLRAGSSLLSPLGFCGMASAFCSPTQLLPARCSQRPEGSPREGTGPDCFSQTPWRGAEAEPVVHALEALPRPAQSPHEPVCGRELFPTVADLAHTSSVQNATLKHLPSHQPC
ncbi:uncharacterized protein LOC135579467 [Columba livia]|uniref:uncharacterized protein LOC135579467 n=1 Tax=Columba livia TaxID=8932 RepID=UPI0031BB2ED7